MSISLEKNAKLKRNLHRLREEAKDKDMILRDYEVQISSLSGNTGRIARSSSMSVSTSHVSELFDLKEMERKHAEEEAEYFKAEYYKLLSLNSDLKDRLSGTEQIIEQQKYLRSEIEKLGKFKDSEINCLRQKIDVHASTKKTNSKRKLKNIEDLENLLEKTQKELSKTKRTLKETTKQYELLKIRFTNELTKFAFGGNCNMIDMGSRKSQVFARNFTRHMSSSMDMRRPGLETTPPCYFNMNEDTEKYLRDQVSENTQLEERRIPLKGCFPFN